MSFHLFSVFSGSFLGEISEIDVASNAVFDIDAFTPLKKVRCFDNCNNIEIN